MYNIVQAVKEGARGDRPGRQAKLVACSTWCTIKLGH